MKRERGGFSALEKDRGGISFYRVREVARREVKEWDHPDSLHCLGFRRRRGNRGSGCDGAAWPFWEINPLWSLNIYGLYHKNLKATNNYNVNTKKKWHVNLETIEGKKWQNWKMESELCTIGERNTTKLKNQSNGDIVGSVLKKWQCIVPPIA
jgi:hypothetical protein